jgi:hypothetical protein
VVVSGNRREIAMKMIRPIYGYKAQYRRTLSYLEIAGRDHTNTMLKDDELITFFMHCAHISDHVHNDPALATQPALRKAVCAAAKRSHLLQYARDIANGSKHCVMRSAAMRGAHDIVMRLGANRQSGTYPRVELPGGRAMQAIRLAKKCANEWRAILTKNGLPLK